MSTQLTVEAQQVQPGDRIYNRGSSNKRDPWVRVTSVEKTQGYTVIQTTDWSTWKHPREGVAVQRLNSKTVSSN